MSWLDIQDIYTTQWRGNTVQMKNELLYVKDYMEYCYRLVLDCMSDLELRRNITIGDHEITPVSSPIRIGVNWEHTLYEDDGKLQVIPHKYEVRKDFDHILDYCLINKHILSNSEQYAEYGKKTIYIAPSLYTLAPHLEGREDIVLTTFIYINHTFPRRISLIQGLLAESLPWKNITGCFNKKELEGVLHSVKILVNIRQESRKKILEELRILPALLCGCLVVCEEALMSELVPYKDCIIWAKLEDIPKKVKEVYSSYPWWYNRIYANQDNLRILSRLHQENKDRLKSALVGVGH